MLRCTYQRIVGVVMRKEITIGNVRVRFSY